MGNHCHYYYTIFLVLDPITPVILLLFTYFYVIIIFFINKCCISSQEHDTNNGEGKVFKAFRALTVAAARGLFGAATIRRKDYMNPPCLEIRGKLYKANVIVLLSLLHYVLAVLITIFIVSIAFSIHISSDPDECNENVDCFIFNITDDDQINGTNEIDCSLLLELYNEMKEGVYAECYICHQPAKVLALLGGYITFIPPLMFSFSNAVHTFIFENSLKKNSRKFCLIFSAILFISNSGPYLYFFLIIFKYHSWHQYIKHINNSDASFWGRLSAIIMTFSSFLAYPWFWLGKYQQKSQPKGGYDPLEVSNLHSNHIDQFEELEQF